MENPLKIAFILNPIAGGRAKLDLERILAETLDATKWRCSIYTTRDKGHATQLVHEAARNGCSYVVAVGGDGTVNEVAAACVDLKLCLGIIPVGSGNGFARELGIPLKPAAAIKFINSGRVKAVDVGVANGKYFFCTAGAGFDAHISGEFDNSGRRGFFTYLFITLKEFLKYRAGCYQIHIGDKVLDKKAFVLTVANARQYGNNAFIAPMANLADGLLDVCVLAPFGWLRSIGLGLRLFSGNIQKSSKFEAFQCTGLSVSSPRAIVFHLDGDQVEFNSPIKFGILPGALSVLAK